MALRGGSREDYFLLMPALTMLYKSIRSEIVVVGGKFWFWRQEKSLDGRFSSQDTDLICKFFVIALLHFAAMTSTANSVHEVLVDKFERKRAFLDQIQEGLHRQTTLAQQGLRGLDLWTNYTHIDILEGNRSVQELAGEVSDSSSCSVHKLQGD